ncbi:hypothetical protein SAMN04487950_1485 [Halogranum rubrum]|uniref:Uncharacterized protein n=1 Tax=Halogranum rubrum TaxID=553466 RepID=A0A1I4CYN2_9EURY|nr:hypothetical protein [Halogranum rubrum]SFK85995.1 hypothetical protein SAMN04487950_1485 [Halogranum rubrum]
MDTRKIETLLTVQTMLLALVALVFVQTTTYFGGALDWFATFFPLFVLLGGVLFLGYHGVEFSIGWLTSDCRGMGSE